MEWFMKMSWLEWRGGDSSWNSKIYFATKAKRQEHRRLGLQVQAMPAESVRPVMEIN